MSFHVEVRNDSMAIVVDLASDFNLQSEVQAFRAALHEALGTQTKPVVLIFDTRTVNISARDVLVATDSDSQNILRHPNIREVVVVTNDVLVQIAAKGVNSFSFGYIKVHTFPTLEAALAYAEESSID